MPALSYWFAAALFLVAAALWKPLERDRARVRAAFGFLILWAAFEICTQAATRWSLSSSATREIARTLLILASIQIGFLLVFDLALRKIRLPRFAAEILIVAAWAAALFDLLKRLGVDATGIFATSAVATAAIGLALQDMLGNLAGGMALQFENSVNSGDYIRCGDQAGWVQHVRLRHTAILTSDGDTVILPNSLLTRSSVTIVSTAHRCLIPFPMPYSRHPQETIDALESALRASPVPGVRSDPAPRCWLREMTPGHIVYAAAVWLSNPGSENEVVSAVLARMYYALERAGIPAAEISYLVENKAAAEAVREPEPADILRRTPIFRLMDDPGIVDLAANLRRLSFGPGERILVQGDSGDSMYFLVSGRVAITLRSADGTGKTLAVFEPGDFFGEASLLTGEPRNATATALSRVACYRLDQAGLRQTMLRQPDLAEDMSVIVAHRQMELSLAREQLDRETALRREAENQTQLLARIRRFFALGGAPSAE